MSKLYDVVVIGSGIAGLSFALKVAEAGHHVAIITKKNSAESNTNYAQGGIAAVTSQTDDVEKHVADTLDKLVRAVQWIPAVTIVKDIVPGCVRCHDC